MILCYPQKTCFLFMPKKFSLFIADENLHSQIADQSDTSTHASPKTNAVDPKLDIGNMDRSSLDDYTKKLILTLPMISKGFLYPTTKRYGRNRSFQETWMKDFPFLAYSQQEDGVYCRPCWLFFHEGVGKGNHEIPGQLVTSCYSNWKNAREDFRKHANKEYHKTCAEFAKTFLEVSSGKRSDIMSLMDKQQAKEKKENRAAIIPIIKTILFCAEQELPLRGDNDSGPLSLIRSQLNDGKFRALLRFRIDSGDVSLEKHVLNHPKNAQYMSPDIQNEIIQICSDIIIRKIIQKVDNAPCFTLLGDETMDISGTEQMSVCLRYLDFDDDLQKLIIREDFVGFVPIYNQTSEKITEALLKRCKELSLEMKKCIGQGYDGARNMSGHVNGVQARMKNLYPLMMYVHCYSHRLNLALSNAMSVPPVRNCLGIVNDVVNLFRNHAYATKILQDLIQEHVPQSKKKRLIRLCETRFIERHDSILSFVELFQIIHMGLEEISEKSWAISKTAACLLAAVQKSEFLVSLLVCNRLFSITLPLSVQLQEKSRDLASAVEHVHEIVNMLQEERTTADVSFSKIFIAAEKLANDTFDMELKVPRLTSKQTTRSNYQTDSVESYFRSAVFIPCLDTLIQNLSDKFLNENAGILSSLQILLPGFAAINKVDDLHHLSPYFDDRVSESAVKAEYKLWCEKLSGLEKDAEALQVLDFCDKSRFPTIKYLLTVLATLPVTTASVERSFSTMKRIKTYLRNSTGNERLSALAVLSIHGNLGIDPNEVLEIMAAKKSRKLKF